MLFRSQKLGNTLFLAGSAAVIAVPLAILLGILAARYAGRSPSKSRIEAAVNRHRSLAA